MTDPFTRLVARYTPHFLAIFFVAAVVGTAISNGPILENTFYASWLLVASAVLTRIDMMMEARK